MLNMNILKESDFEKIEEELCSKKKARSREKMQRIGQAIVSLWKTVTLRLKRWGEKYRGRHFSYVKIDVSSFASKYRLLVDVPGVTEDDLEVELSPNRIVIGCRRADVPTVYKERKTGDARRTIWFAKRVDPKTCQTKLVGGLLEVEIDYAKSISDSDSSSKDEDRGTVRARTPERARAAKSGPVFGLNAGVRELCSK